MHQLNASSEKNIADIFCHPDTLVHLLQTRAPAQDDARGIPSTTLTVIKVKTASHVLNQAYGDLKTAYDIMTSLQFLQLNS
jgi:hypothetical protein